MSTSVLSKMVACTVKVRQLVNLDWLLFWLGCPSKIWWGYILFKNFDVPLETHFRGGYNVTKKTDTGLKNNLVQILPKGNASLQCYNSKEV